MRIRGIAICTVVVFSLLFTGLREANAVTVLNIESGAIALSASGIDFTTNTVQTGSFVGLSGTVANTSDLSFAAPSVANFITFQAAPTQSINLTSISAGAFSSVSCFAAPAPGQTCTAPGIPLSFINTPTGVVASFTVQGTANLSGVSTPITGIYTLQLAGTNYQSALATLSGGGSVRTTYSVEFSGASGSFTLGGSLALSSTGVDFTPTTMIGVPNPSRFIISSSSTGSFVPLAGTAGVALDLLYATTPPGDPVSIANFLTFLSDPTRNGSLSLLDEGVFSASSCFSAPALGQTCTLPDSALMFANVSGGSLAIFDVRGLFNGSLGSAPYVGLFSLPFDVSYQFLLDAFSNQRAFVGSYAASFSDVAVIATPEPGTLGLVVFGGLVVALRARARRRRSASRSRDC